MHNLEVGSSTILKEDIAIVWFKRDLRFTDHEPLFFAQKEHLPILPIYCFEPTVMNYADSDVRHWRFVFQSIQEMQTKLSALNRQIAVFHDEAIHVFQKIAKHYNIKTIFSHQEIGNKITYDRDLAIKQFCLDNHIEWKEYQHNGVVRKLKSRKNWEELWKQKMQETPKLVELNNLQFLKLDTVFYESIKGTDLNVEITVNNNAFQTGGESWAWKYLQSFLKDRYINYSKHISKPALSRKGCSRISPYLAYGNISMRMVYQFTMHHYETASDKKALSNFVSRLYWHCHFMQKFEDECRMEF